MTSIHRRVLEGRGNALAVFILFLCLGAWSWASLTNTHHLTHDPFYVGGLLFAVFITASITYRSSLSVDRIAFGAASAAFLLAAVATTTPLGPVTVLALHIAKSLMWTLAAAVALVVLVRGSKMANRDA
jgi:hypothetical protein